MLSDRFVVILASAFLTLTIPYVALGQSIVCPNTQWDFQNPSPLFHNFSDIWGISSTSIYAVGSSGAIYHFDGQIWTLMDSPTTSSLRAVWGSSDDNVYAVGDNGTVLWFDGVNWNQVPGPNNTATLEDVHGGGGNVYIIDGLHIYGASPTHWWVVYEFFCGIKVSDSCTHANALWVSPQGNYCVVGSHRPHNAYPEWTEGFVIGLHNKSFNSMGLYDVWGSTENDIYVLAQPDYSREYGYRVFHYDGTDWNQLNPPRMLKRISGASTMDVFGLVDDRLIFYDGAAWTITTDAPGIPVTALWGASSDDIHIVGGKFIAHYDGDSYEIYGSSDIGTARLRDIWASAPDNAYAVGEGNDLFHYDGTEWNRVPGVSGSLYGIWGSSATDIFAVGDYGQVLHYNGSSWDVSSLDADVLRDVTGRSSGDVYAVGEKGTGRVFHFNGVGWRLIGYIPQAAYSVFATPSFVFVGTANGSVWRYDNNAWVEFPEVLLTAEVLSIWGTSADDLWIGGTTNFIEQLDGTTGQVVKQVTSEDAYLYDAQAIWGSSSTNFFVAGRNGFIYHYDGIGLYADARVHGQNLHGIFGTSACEVFAVGDGGIVLFLDAIRDGTQIAIDTSKNRDGRTIVILPGEEVCGHFMVIPRHRFIEVAFDVSGDNLASDTSLTNYNGEVAFCYTPGRAGTDRIAPSLVHPGVSYIADTLTLHLIAPQIVFDSSQHTNGETVYVLPGADVCAYVKLNRPVEGVIVDFIVTGANSSDGSIVTDADGKASFCYPALGVGRDTIVATTTSEFPAGSITSTDTLVLCLAAPTISFDPAQQADGDTVTVLAGAEVCTYVELNVATAGANIDFTVSGANSSDGSIVTDPDGKASFCYPALGVGRDTIVATATFDFPAGPISPTDTLTLFIEPAEFAILVDSDYHGATDTLIVLPGCNVGVHFWTFPPVEDALINFTVVGANGAKGVGQTGADGKVTWHYTPLFVGADTVKAVWDTQSNAILPLYLKHPMLSYDPYYQDAGDSVLVLPGENLCTRFNLDRDAASVQVNFQVTGANSVVDTGMTDDLGSVDFCYPVTASGLDIITAEAQFDFGGAMYTTSDMVTFTAYSPSIAVDDSYHTGVDSVITTPDCTVCGHFVVCPPLEGVHVDYVVRGANPQAGTAASNAAGLVKICYPAPNAGVDTLVANVDFVIAGTLYERSAILILVVIQGAHIPLVLDISTALALDEFRTIDVSLSSNKELDSPMALFRFHAATGGESQIQKEMTLDSEAGWIYHARYRRDDNGRLDVSITAADLYGNCGEMCAIYDICRTDQYSLLDWASNDDVVHLHAPWNAVTTSGLLLVVRDSVRTTPTLDDGTELTPVSDVLGISTSSNFVAKPTLTIRYLSGTMPDVASSRSDSRKVGIYQRLGSYWTYVDGQGDGTKVMAKVDVPGDYAAFYNEAHEVIPAATALYQNYPNPFKSSTTITVDLHVYSNVELAIYNVAGQRVRTLANAPRNEGVHEFKWNGRDDAGRLVASGVYLSRLKTATMTQTKKMVLLK